MSRSLWVGCFLKNRPVRSNHSHAHPANLRRLDRSRGRRRRGPVPRRLRRHARGLRRRGADQPGVRDRRCAAQRTGDQHRVVDGGHDADGRLPAEGSSFAILSSGNAADAYGAQSEERSTNHGLGGRAGGSDFDATVLRVDLTVPASANCLMGFDFKFLSEEYPEWVGQSYNDAFIAELDASTWTSDGTTITAPRNFAFDPNGNVVSINAAGEAVLNSANAAGTAFDGGTEILTAATPLTPGPHSIFFTIFDQADGTLDSAVLIDNLRIGHVNDTATECQPGVSAPKTQVTPAAATFSDPYGAASDTYTVPSTLGVEYRVDGVPAVAGTYPGTGTVAITAVADEGYEVTGTSAWSHTFTDVQPATAAAPTQADGYGTADDTYTVPTATGVQYRVGGADVAAGTYPGAGTVVVTAVAQAGYELTAGETSWSLPFTDITLVTAEDPSQVDTYSTPTTPSPSPPRRACSTGWTAPTWWPGPTRAPAPSW